MFDYLWKLFKGQDDPETIKVKNFLRSWIVRKRFLRKREAAIAIQSAFRYKRTRKNIRQRLRNEGEYILNHQFALKQNWLLKLRGELYNYISQIEGRLDQL